MKQWDRLLVAFSLGVVLGVSITIKSNQRLLKEATARVRAECAEMYMAPLTVTVTKTPPSVTPPPLKRVK